MDFLGFLCIGLLSMVSLVHGYGGAGLMLTPPSTAEATPLGQWVSCRISLFHYFTIRSSYQRTLTAVMVATTPNRGRGGGSGFRGDRGDGGKIGRCDSGGFDGREVGSGSAMKRGGRGVGGG